MQFAKIKHLFTKSQLNEIYCSVTDHLDLDLVMLAVSTQIIENDDQLNAYVKSGIASKNEYKTIEPNDHLLDQVKERHERASLTAQLDHVRDLNRSNRILANAQSTLITAYKESKTNESEENTK